MKLTHRPRGNKCGDMDQRCPATPLLQPHVNPTPFNHHLPRNNKQHHHSHTTTHSDTPNPQSSPPTMQSGISASAELTAQFTTLLATPSHFGLLATIQKEQLVPLRLLTSSPGSSFSSNITTLLTPHITPDQALYIILRRHPTAPALVAVTYVPDAAPVRQKMLFASTRLTLVRELGSEHFRETIFATTPHELTAAGFEKHDAHEKLDAPLTEEERTLGEVKRAEQEAGSGTAAREIHLSKNLAMPVDEGALGALKALGEGGEEGLVMLVSTSQVKRLSLVWG